MWPISKNWTQHKNKMKKTFNCWTFYFWSFKRTWILRDLDVHTLQTHYLMKFISIAIWKSWSCRLKKSRDPSIKLHLIWMESCHKWCRRENMKQLWVHFLYNFSYFPILLPLEHQLTSNSNFDHAKIYRVIGRYKQYTQHFHYPHKSFK